MGPNYILRRAEFYDFAVNIIYGASVSILE